jgi:hypothetical protein
VLLAAQAKTAAYSGHLRKAREFWRQAVISALRAEKKESAVGYELDAFWWEALFGNATEARRQVEVALALTRSRYAQSLAAVALAWQGMRPGRRDSPMI